MDELRGRRGPPPAGGGGGPARVQVVSTISDMFDEYTRSGSGGGAGAGRAGAREGAAAGVPRRAPTHLSAGEAAALERVWQEARRDLKQKERELTDLHARDIADVSLSRTGALLRESLARQLAEERDRARFLELQLADASAHNEQL
jgi:hypothetical protein